MSKLGIVRFEKDLLVKLDPKLCHHLWRFELHFCIEGPKHRKLSNKLEMTKGSAKINETEAN